MKNRARGGWPLNWVFFRFLLGLFLSFGIFLTFLSGFFVVMGIFGCGFREEFF